MLSRSTLSATTKQNTLPSNPCFIDCSVFQCTKKYFKDELSNILYIAQVNGFPKTKIMQLFNKIKNKFHLNNITPLVPITNKPDTKYYSIPFIGNTSLKIKKLLNEFNITISFSSSNNIKTLLSHIKDPTPPDSKSGVYALSCATCPSHYIGVTRRSFNVRFNEHISQIINNLVTQNSRVTSNFASHVLDNNHMYSRNLKVIHNSNNSYLDEILEKYYIYIDNELRPDHLINEQLNFSNIDLFKNLFQLD